MKSGCSNTATTGIVRGGVTIPACAGCARFEKNHDDTQRMIAADRDNSAVGVVRRTDPISGRTWLERGTECV